MEDDHHVFAEVARLLCLAFAQAFASSHHEHNRHDTPGNPEHRQEGAKLVRPEGSQDVEDEITQRHDTCWTRPGRESNARMLSVRYAFGSTFVAAKIRKRAGPQLPSGPGRTATLWCKCGDSRPRLRSVRTSQRSQRRSQSTAQIPAAPVHT